jgi:hypothetical protein
MIENKMKKFKTLILSSMASFLLVGITIISMNLLEFSQLMRADVHVSSVRYIEGDNVRDEVLLILYDGLRDDYCGLKTDQQSLLFKYTLDEEFIEKITKIEKLFATILKKQYEQSIPDC